MMCPVCKVGIIYESQKLRRCDRCMSDFGVSRQVKVVSDPQAKKKVVVETVRQISLFDGEFDVFGRYRPK